MIKIGSRVKFLNEPGGGTVTRIVGNEAYVQDEDGFEIPTLLSNLILDAGSDMYEQTALVKEDENTAEEFKADEPSQKVEKTEEKLAVTVAEYAEKFMVYLAFVLEVDSTLADERRVGIYLINEGEYFLYYAFGLDVLQKRKNMGHGRLEPQMMAKIGSFSVRLLHEYSALSVGILPYNVTSYAVSPLFQLVMEWSQLNLMASSSFQPNDYFDEPAVIIDLKQQSEIQQKKELLLRETRSLPKDEIAVQKPVVKEVEEVDLHIDKIVSADQLTQLSAAQILEIQLDRFTFALESAIKARTKRIVFIHGVGNGKLRYEIQKILRRKYPHLDFQDASFAEYGYGATMVILRK
ncbi:MAG: DUF2027 domain-containing protein [Bacteroidales bacterium]